MTKRRSQSKHDKMVRRVAELLAEKGYRNIKADIKGYEKPDRIIWCETRTGHIPDVTAWDRNGKFNLFEVETEDSIYDQHTEEQWRLFSAYARQHSAKFWVVVPKGWGADAQRRADELGVSAEICEISDP